MNVVLPELGSRLAESLYDEVMDIACDLRALLRGGIPAGIQGAENCLSYVRATGTVTAEIISLVCWACAYRAVQGRDMEVEPFVALARELGEIHPGEVGTPGDDDYQCLEGLDHLRCRIETVAARVRRLENVSD
ncbi:hypothetical protein MTBLM5_90075 [Magnetospirillum sp. LM-5]|uniref:hypothetical protein n=1 Tax=Magnetospirillum sp. LM-5 TaxID=2681466 RepID=UPI0013800D80|nr:hypothetical protein [Magnetospirillum sp. LM-5]CAA7625913.1 hypothetical protein MTBLM5_90075 [Magnetospirillum sp. LM-5]